MSPLSFGSCSIHRTWNYSGLGPPTSPLYRILAWPEGGVSQVLRVYFFGTKRTVWTSEPHLYTGGVWRGCLRNLHPVPHSQIHACPPCIPCKSQPLCKIPAEKKILKKKKIRHVWEMGSRPAVSKLQSSGGPEYSQNVFQMLYCPSRSCGAR